MPTSYSSYFFALLLNLIPLIGVLIYDWHWAEVIQIYVIEYYILFFFDIFRIYKAKDSLKFPAQMFPMLLVPGVMMMCGAPVLYLYCLTLIVPIKFLAWSHFQFAGLILFVFHLLGYIQTNWISKGTQVLKKEDVIAQSVSRLAVIMSVAVFGPIFVGVLPIREKGLVLMMVMVRVILDIWNLNKNSSQIRVQ